MQEYNWNQLFNVGYITGTMPEDVMTVIRQEIKEIQSDFSKATLHTYELAGQIKHEYLLFKSKKMIESALIPYIYEYDRIFNYIEHLSFLTKNVPFKLHDVWVNYQQKTEYNPIHNHSGFMSFTLWVNIPYDMKDERLASPGANSNNNRAGNFVFHYMDATSIFRNSDFPISKELENKFILFPSSMLHSVNPFYSSDDYRISVAGNFRFDVG